MKRPESTGWHATDNVTLASQPESDEPEWQVYLLSQPSSCPYHMYPLHLFDSVWVSSVGLWATHILAGTKHGDSGGTVSKFIRSFGYVSL